MAQPTDMPDLHAIVRDRIEGAIAAKEALLRDEHYQNQVIRVAVRIAQSLSSGGKVIFFGNGGSAADAQHLAAEFTGRCLKDRPALAAIALNVNSSSITAIGNDYGFDSIFARQLEALGKEGDVAIAISTSGNSPNVIRGLETAKSKSICTVSLTGNSGGKLKSIAEYAICIPSEETTRIQECHILTGHLICEAVEQTLFHQSKPGNHEANFRAVPEAQSLKAKQR
jgi:D-sedoheptulose 7-phosphate isomerase